MKEEANKELVQVERHQVLHNITYDVLSNYINQEVPGCKLLANDATDEEIFISDKEINLLQEITNKDVQAQRSRCSESF